MDECPTQQKVLSLPYFKQMTMAETRKMTRTPKTSKAKPVDEYGHLQPQAPELEEAVLGALMIEKDAYSLVSEILRPESFYERRHQLIYSAITSLALRQQPVDILTVAEQLRSTGELEDAGGPFYITQLSGKVASSAHIEYHARIIAQKFLARELITFTSNIQTKAFDETQDVDDLMQEAEGKLFEISQQNMKKDYTQINPVIQEAYEMLQKAAARTDGLSGLESGFHALDKMTSGWQNSDLVIIAARPAMGKTAFVLNVVDYVSVRKNLPCMVFSLEMSKEQLVNRMLSMESNVDSQKLRTGTLTDSDWDAVVEGIGIIGNSKLIIDDTPGISISELRSKCRKMKLEYGLSIVIIDYLQLMSGSRKGGNDNRQQEISDISRSLKALARELHAPVIALSQLSRACETRTDHRPMLSDLRESGAIEQDADVVMFLYRDDYYNKDTEHPNEAEVIIAKQRNGPIGTVNLIWKPEYTKFVNAVRPQGGNQEG